MCASRSVRTAPQLRSQNSYWCYHAPQQRLNWALVPLKAILQGHQMGRGAHGSQHGEARRLEGIFRRQRDRAQVHAPSERAICRPANRKEPLINIIFERCRQVPTVMHYWECLAALVTVYCRKGTLSGCRSHMRWSLM